MKFLQKAKWSLEQACNNFWEFPPAENELQAVVDTDTIRNEFNKYAGTFRVSMALDGGSKTEFFRASYTRHFFSLLSPSLTDFNDEY